MSTTTERLTPTPATDNGIESHLSEQVVLSGAGLMSEGIERTRSGASAALDVVDEMVFGALDIIEELNAMSVQLLPQLTSELTVKPTTLAKKAYGTASGALRQALRDL